MWHLGHAVGLLLDPQPRFGTATIDSAADGGAATRYEVAFTRSPDQWRTQAADSPEVSTCDGTTVALFRAGRRVEAAPARGTVPPPLWLLFPRQAFIWGRDRDNWRLCEQPEYTDGTLTVAVERMEHPDVRGHITIDLGARMVVEMVLPRRHLRLADLDITAPEPALFATGSD